MDDYIPAMLAKDTESAFTKTDWLFEIKWDGYRAIAELNKTQVKLYSRNGNSFLNAYPTVVEELSSLELNAVFDGEIVVLNEEGNPDFQKLQHYEEYSNFPIIYYVFDLLELNGKKLYSLPLLERKKRLSDILGTSPVVKFSDHIEESGEDFFELIRQKNLEGIMAKRKDSAYHPGKRSADWLKIKHHKTEEAIIAGFTAPRGGRKYFGALVLGSFVDGKLTYVGHTGSGFNEHLLKEISVKLQPLIREKSPFAERVKTNMPVTWLDPNFVCEIKFTEWTSDGKLRHPIFLRLREDKTPADVNTQFLNAVQMKEVKQPEENTQVREEKPNKKEVKNALKKEDRKEEISENVTDKKKPVSKKSLTIKKETAEKDALTNEQEKTYSLGKAQIKTTNRTKIFFPDDGITKGDVIDYYDLMGDLLIPYLKDRPESLFRTPNGINQKGFFHKDAGDNVPSWVKHIPLYSDSVKKDIDYILCNNKATLLYLANLGCIEINPWHSTIKSLDKPDYLIIDIDPSDNNTFEQVVEAAIVVKAVLDQAGATGICKTSGASGLHIYVPLGARYTYDQAKDFANIVCMLANSQIPEFTTLERSLSKRRKDKIYMDYLQNRKGQTIACVYSLRPKQGGTVSTPLEWSEVKKGLTPKDFTIETVPARVQKMGDLFAPVFDRSKAINLAKCIENLGG